MVLPVEATVRMVCFSFSMTGLAPMMLSSELRDGRIAAEGEVLPAQRSFSSERLMASRISSTSPGLLRM
mgnify:CR=1 FL=1